MRTICRDHTADRPQDSLGFLLADVSRLMRRAFARRFEGNELTFAQARVLVYVARSPGLRQVELASRLEIQPITLVRLIDGLAARDLVERCVDPSDRRAWLVYPTAHAQGSLASIRRVGESVREDALAGIAPAQAEALLRVLASMRGNLATENDGDNDKAGEDEEGRENERGRASHRRSAPPKARRTRGAAARQAK